ncbi:GNAT family N-acetyltransferase [uncultured Brachyspira sp.]|uniref:GNAT family N-acetyltransferase n=1 Tax=uncultured Brachyspira sp. TaxID=221953 RepID=UPI0026385760|nr:GNAT family N-acetyltransferase [uncultured Brachyspira sp.]
MKDKKFNIRFAEINDIPTIMRFIKELALYEHLENELKLTEESLKENIFYKKKAEIIIAFEDDIPIGYAVFFETFSTFEGKHCIYLDDLYINDKYRGFGYGKRLFKEIAEIAYERNCGRFEWQCLDWNKSSIDFYLSMNAEMVKDARVYRLTNEALKKLISI